MAPPNSSCGAPPHRLRLARAGGTSHPALRDPRQRTLSGPGNVAVTGNAFIVPCGGDVCQNASTNPLQVLRSWPRPSGQPRPHSPALLAFPRQVSFLSWTRSRFPGLLTIPPPQSSNWKGGGGCKEKSGGSLPPPPAQALPPPPPREDGGLRARLHPPGSRASILRRSTSSAPVGAMPSGCL
ncbi:unnamed protein product [Rangifer tarandus platyrhynchus]|uniref:Uncharacterized protein n=1 Tax=Rangifer tarandus platyrhynchus TaxID=3082113 RepID=A0AC59Y4I1_RANTA